MQNILQHSERSSNDRDDPACERQFSDIVIDFQNQVEEIIAGLFSKEEELQRRPDELSLKEAGFYEILKEYSEHEKFLSLFNEYCHTVIQCKELGQELKDNGENLTDEDRDEIGIQIDAMSVCCEKLKILALDRLQKLRELLEERQFSQIERLEEWLSTIEMKIKTLDDIGPDYASIQRQIEAMRGLDAELEKKQDFLNFISKVVIFDEIDSESLNIRRRSCESLDNRLDEMNRRWTNVCRQVGDRNRRLKVAESIWKLLNSEEPYLASWLNQISARIEEISKGAHRVSDVQKERAFVEKALSKSKKIDSEIKDKQSFYTSLENRVRAEIEKFDIPCSMTVIELMRKLEDIQDDWNTVMTRKRMLDYDLQALTKSPLEDQVQCSMIPLPDPITSNSDNDIPLDYPAPRGSSSDQRLQAMEALNTLSSSGSDNRERSLQLDCSSSDPRAFDNSLSSGARSLIYGNEINYDGLPSMGDRSSHDDLPSSANITSSYPTELVSPTENYAADLFSANPFPEHNEGFVRRLDNRVQDEIIPCSGPPESHSCRVEEWRHSLDSFSTWLRQVEHALGILVVDSAKNSADWSKVDLEMRVNLLTDIEERIKTTCQDEFDCLLLQGQQIIEDLMPEIEENEYEVNLKEILGDIELRFANVKKYLNIRKEELTDREKLQKLSRSLRDSSAYLIDMMGRVVPETDIGVDLITLAQQQEELVHLKEELCTNCSLQSCKHEAKLFLKICEVLKQYDQSNRRDDYTRTRNFNQTNPSQDSIIFDIWLSFKKFKDDIEEHFDELTLHDSDLLQLIEDRLERLEEVHKEMHALQQKIQELATKLQVAEILKSNWVPLENLSIEQLSEQIEDLKLYRERLIEVESIHKAMNSIFEWMTKSDVPLSQSNLKRLSELNTIWSLIQVSVEERQKLIEQAFDNQGASEQRFLTQTVSDLPRWERKVTASKVPYFIDQESNKTHWDHPKFSDLLNSLSETKKYVYSVYRTALKLRLVQRQLGTDMLMLEQLSEILDSHVPDRASDEQTAQVSEAMNHCDFQVGVVQIIEILKAIYEKIEVETNVPLNVPLSIDLTLNWLLNLYDSTRTGHMNILSLKVGLILLCCATREEKYTRMYKLVANTTTGNAEARKLGTLFEACMRIPIYLGEGESFGGSESVEKSIRNCFSQAKFNPRHPNSIDLEDYLSWLKSEPLFIIWLIVLHRLHISEKTVHFVRCKLCGQKPIVGLRYRCLKCFRFNVCQECFLTGRNVYEHFDPASHQMEEYCNKSSSGESVRVLTKILRNKLKPRPVHRTIE